MRLAVEEYIFSHPNWQKELAEKPFCIRIRENPDIPGEFIFSYNQIESDFYNEVVRDCRGLILRVSGARETERVCYAFRKFGNYGEPWADDIDWKAAVVRDKVDGSLIRRFYRGGELCYATNNSFNADGDVPNDLPLDNDDGRIKTFQHAINAALLPEEFFEEQKDWTIMFELTSPWNRVVVNYGPLPKLWLLGARNRITCGEITPEEAKARWRLPYDTPAPYPLATISGCLKAAEALGKDREGFVVQDKAFRRLKVKGAAYLQMHHLKDESGGLSLKHVFACIQRGMIDDVIAAFPEHTAAFQKMIDSYSEVKSRADAALKYAEGIRADLARQNLEPREARKRYALTVTGDDNLKNYSPLLFTFLKHDSTEGLAEAWIKEMTWDDFCRRCEQIRAYG